MTRLHKNYLIKNHKGEILCKRCDAFTPRKKSNNPLGRCSHCARKRQIQYKINEYGKAHIKCSSCICTSDDWPFKHTYSFSHVHVACPSCTCEGGNIGFKYYKYLRKKNE